MTFPLGSIIHVEASTSRSGVVGEGAISRLLAFLGAEPRLTQLLFSGSLRGGASGLGGKPPKPVTVKLLAFAPLAILHLRSINPLRSTKLVCNGAVKRSCV